MKNCKAAGCSRGASGYGHYCNAHRSRLKRHGDVRQMTITAAYLKPHMAELDTWLRRQPGAEKAWAIIEEHFEAMVAQAEGVIRCSVAGPQHRPTVDACRDVVAVSREADRRNAILLVMGMIILHHREQRGVFASQKGFVTQLSRRWRGLTHLHLASYPNLNGGRTKLVYRDANRQRAKALGELLIEGLGPCAVSIISAQQREAERHAKLMATNIGAVLLNEAHATIPHTFNQDGTL